MITPELLGFGAILGLLVGFSKTTRPGLASLAVPLLNRRALTLAACAALYLIV